MKHGNNEFWFFLLLNYTYSENPKQKQIKMKHKSYQLCYVKKNTRRFFFLLKTKLLN
jgi:hypothetical protein